MHCTDCNKPIERCICSPFGGKHDVSASVSNELLCGDIKDVIKNCDPETLQLAKLVAAMPPPPTDDAGIEKWAKRLAADISKFND